MSRQLKAGLRGSYSQPTEKDASTQTDITGVHTSLEDRTDRKDRGEVYGLQDAIAGHEKTARRRQRITDDVSGGEQDSGALPASCDLGQQGESRGGGATAGAGAAHQADHEGGRPGGAAGALIEFQRLQEAITEELPEELEGLTDHLVEVGLLRSDRRVVRGEWPLGDPGDRWEKLRGTAAKERRRVLAWATAARDMLQGLRSGKHPSPNGSGSPESSGPSPRGVLRTDAEVQRMMEAAVAAALGKRDAGGKGGSNSGRASAPASLRDVSKTSMGRSRGWTWSECVRVITEIRVAAAQQAADLARVKHSYRRHPTGRVEPWALELVDEKFASCRQDQCGLEELPEEEKEEARHYAWHHLRKFYDHLCYKMEKEASVTFELLSSTAHWEMYKREKNIKAKGTGGGGGGGRGGGYAPGVSRFPRKTQEQPAAVAPREGAQQAHQELGKGNPRNAIKTGACFSFNSVARCDRRNCKFAHNGSTIAGGAGHGAGGASGGYRAVRDVGTQVPLMSKRAHLMAEALKDWPDVAFLVRGAACGVKFPFAGKEPDEPYVVENYVGEEHESVVTKELAKELAAGRIFDARDWLPRGVSALGMVERLRKGKLKYRPVWDYSGLSFIGVNDWIDVQKDKFTSVKDAYTLLRPGMYMVKVDLEEAYSGSTIAGGAGHGAGGASGGYRAVRDVGTQVPLMSKRAHLMAEALKDWPDVAFLVRGAACGVKFPFAGKEPDEPYVVENYVGEEHESVVTKELAKELAAGRIFDARDWLPRGVSALGMVERLRKGKLKYRPVWDYSGLSFIGVNDWIDVQKDKFTSVKDAYTLLRPGMYMVKVDLEEAYSGSTIAGGAGHGAGGASGGYRAVRDVGTQVPLMSKRAHLMAEALKDWPDVAFLVRGAACGVKFPFAGKEPDEPYVVENYVGEEHESVVTKELAKELAAGRIFDARDWLPRGVSALGMVERLRKGKLKYRPVWDYSRLSFIGVNDWIDLQKDKFTSVKDAYALLRPGMYMVKDLKVVERVIRLYNGRKVVLHKEDVHEDAFATDASLRKEMGGQCASDYFLLSWDDLAEMPQRDFYPFTSKAKSHINYLELFARREVLWRQERDDLQFSPFLFAEMDEEFGPFTPLQDVRRAWDRLAKPVMPITLRDLARMAEFADMETITGAALWAAILVGFYGLFRKDNLTVGKSQARNTRGALVREDVLFAVAGDVVWIRVRHSKTIQLMLAMGDLPEEAPLFQVEGRGKRGALVPMTHAVMVMVAGLKKLAEQVSGCFADWAAESLLSSTIRGKL
ncbi:hypothetical protein CYMTET_45136 [Cymbomonas tetramitiformis]|uniref:C3H1-type domain-containing protein n=1 Tax=Cymbomonas tetramitiformis TaxID=36881 RepID=A0AAE0C042_9CHLO|nr:hypothetical protein CYMTET_45136 [Cymbomonas tetramitiformis]